MTPCEYSHKLQPTFQSIVPRIANDAFNRGFLLTTMVEAKQNGLSSNNLQLNRSKPVAGRRGISIPKMLSRSKQLVGLDIGSSNVKAVELKVLGPNRYQLVGLGLETLPADTIVDGAIISKLPVADAISKIFKTQKIKNRRVATSISGHSVIVKKIQMPTQSSAELAESIHWEAEQYIPFDINDVNLDYQIIRDIPGTGNMEVLLVAVKRDKITDQNSVISMAGKTPVVVDIDAFALQNCYEVNYQPSPTITVALLDLGASTLNVNIVKGSEFLFARDISVGGNNYTDFLQKELSLDYDEAEATKRRASQGETSDRVQKVLRSTTEMLTLEVQKTFDYFRATVSSGDIDRILLGGGACHTPGLAEYMTGKLQVKTEILDSFRSIEIGPGFSKDYVQSISPDMAVAVGLALRNANEQ